LLDCCRPPHLGVRFFSAEDVRRLRKAGAEALVVEIGPYCVVGPHVELKDGVRLIGQVNITGVTTVGEGTVVYPFASLGTSPQSVRYRGEPTQLVIGARLVR
jgi:acyl-[acyl carrier protein]--UDP-N-acetylglucosamine O-acyltransferase